MKIVVATFLIVMAPLALLGQTTPTGVDEYFITCHPDSFRYIYEHPLKDHYIPITLTHQDKSYANARMRIRGDSSRELPKKSFKIKFDGQPFSDGRH